MGVSLAGLAALLDTMAGFEALPEGKADLLGVPEDMARKRLTKLNSLGVFLV